MDTSKLKKYAPQARKDFIAAVTDRAATFGLTAKKMEPVDQKGDVAVIGTRAYPRSVAAKRKRLEDRIHRDGFDQVMEAIAYTWFNRLVALRYMELHGYLDHTYRVLSHPEGSSTPEVVEHAEHVDLPGLDKNEVIELKLDATKESALYRLLLVAQCNALSSAMPFLFERIDDETELLLPENLLHSDSLIRKLVQEIPEELWDQIEIIGWIYQFYISEKKDQVIGKVVKSEDIPAATQLFTPNWIVKCMVQNSLGAQWLATYPQSPLKGQMEYYIESAEQTEEVEAQIAEITPKELNPEELTLIDPACGSGHILVEAYDLLKAIFLERGYRAKDVPRLILEKNLFGLEIDDRAAQLAAFALMMKARADDRRLFERGVKLNVVALMDSTSFDAERLAQGVRLADYALRPTDLTELKRVFEHATTFGSLIQVSEGLATKLAALMQLSEATSEDLFVSDALGHMGALVRQAAMLTAQYDAVVANPPYMGGKGMNPLVKSFAKDHFPDAKSDLFGCFIERGCTLAKRDGRIAMVTMQSWMFLSSFEKMRQRLLTETTICAMAQIGYNSFPSMNSKIAQATVFAIANAFIANHLGVYINLNRAPQSADKRELFLRREPQNRFEVASREFHKIPGSPIAYWVSARVREAFDVLPSMKAVAPTRQGLATGDNNRFLRCWYEVAHPKISLDGPVSGSDQRARRWFPCNKGGEFRRWYGNNDFIVNWGNDGEEIKAFVDEHGRLRSRPQNESYYFREGLTWSAITSSGLSMRYSPETHMFETKGAMCFPSSREALWAVLGFTNSRLVDVFLSATSPTLDFHEGPVGNLPYQYVGDAVGGVERSVMIARNDWDAYERSWDFRAIPILTASPDSTAALESSYIAWITKNRDLVAELKRLEEENNRLFIDAYGLAGELMPDVHLDEITLTVNPAYRYRGNLTEEEQWIRFREDSMQELISYAIGCMLGRYSLDEPGLVYAQSGNEGFDASRYRTFPADADGIVPLTHAEWFDDDACNRLIEFISVAWAGTHLEENLIFMAESLSPNKKESSRDTIRRYLCDSFFKDHLQTYKKRPIYWLFSSGKQKAFQCLVYLHRYNEGTLARMRTEYVVPLQGMMSARIDQLEGDIAGATSTSHQKKLEKEQESLVKRQSELQEFDERLRHYADQRIALDLDDGVKVNYGKFSDLLAEVKAITGTKAS